MARHHDQAQTKLELRTVLDPYRMAEISSRATDEIMNVRYEEATRGRLRFSVRSFGPFGEIMIFSIFINSTEYGSEIYSVIEQYRHSQQKVGFVPVSRKTMDGHRLFLRYLRTVADTVTSLDGTAQIRIAST